MQRALSELARRSCTSLPTFVEMVRGQTAHDYRPNKSLVPEILAKLCTGYQHLDNLLMIAREGVYVHLQKTPVRQQLCPPNHGSARDRVNILRKNIRKEQDAWRCLVLDADLLDQWPQIIISPFGVVDKGGNDASISGRAIHGLSYPEGDSINDCTDPDSVIKPEYSHYRDPNIKPQTPVPKAVIHMTTKAKPTGEKSANAAKALVTNESRNKNSQKKVSSQKLEGLRAKSMRWTVQLAGLAVEARYKTKMILQKFAKKTSDTKAIRAMGEDTINVFLQRALEERAWGDGEPRNVTVKQFKNKLNSIRSGYRLKRARLMATGNLAHDDSSNSDVNSDDSRSPRDYPEMPKDYFLDPRLSDSESDCSTNQRKQTYDRLSVRSTYRAVLGVELAGLWPLLCDVFSHRPGRTGEAITESGTVTQMDLSSSGASENDQEEVHDSEWSNTPTEAHAKAKATAKSKKHRDPIRQITGVKRPADAVSDTLQAGFQSFERVLLARRNPPQSTLDMPQLIGKLSSSIEAANAAQQATSQALLQGISVTAILRAKRKYPHAKVEIMAGDVASAFRNISIHSNSVYLFAGQIEEENVLVIELSAPFGWTGSPGFMMLSAAQSLTFTAPITTLPIQPGFLTIIGSMITSTWLQMSVQPYVKRRGRSVSLWKLFSKTCQRVLGLEFDSVAELVSMPQAKMDKARGIVASVYSAKFLTRKAYCSLMGSLRHVATCLRAARPFLQRLRVRESHLNRFQYVPVSAEMKQDLLWWWLGLHTPQLNGVSLELFNVLPPPDIVVEVDASDFGLCALDTAAHRALTYRFPKVETDLINEFNAGSPNGYDINFREPLSCAFAVHTWSPPLGGSPST
ncbi:hypothetical protein PHPALM_30436 [Phytophthora palmivora]|uniref:Uncharacterized protein n=1 Tax=Phytophthora palmivora TaxID=4796 RepID=A0A2P4X547_9STRA|nr:hypothetical protein PHPALM_30436 [Phytophthora palmivora]